MYINVYSGNSTLIPTYIVILSAVYLLNWGNIFCKEKGWVLSLFLYFLMAHTNKSHLINYIIITNNEVEEASEDETDSAGPQQYHKPLSRSKSTKQTLEKYSDKVRTFSFIAHWGRDRIKVLFKVLPFICYQWYPRNK